MPEDTPTYFGRRAREEREHAEAAKDFCARQAHQRIAAEYERLAGTETEPQLHAVAR
jgi:hypothetical protein